MGEVELPEMPELEEEKRKDKLNTLVAITVTLLVTFMAICKITDNNVVLLMQQAQADKVDKWSWFQALNIRDDIRQSKLADLQDNLQQEDNAERKKAITAKIGEYEAKIKKDADKKDTVKEEAREEEKKYGELNETHEKFDYTEGAISIAVSLLAMTTLLQKRWMYAVSLVPALFGIVKGVMGLMG
jgi:vacuolar-type H+-ATPase subunit I/STV1